MVRWDPVLDGYVHGPAAAREATGAALARIADPAVMILVEGVSDQIAVETLAQRRGRDLLAEGVLVVPIGGAHAVGRFRREHPTVAAVGLCDAAEQELFTAVLGPDDVFVCEPDLEGELLRAVGNERMLAIVAEQGELRRLTTMSAQAAWSALPVEARLQRFITSRARAKHRYARLLVEAAVDADAVPGVLDGVLRRARPTGTERPGTQARPAR